MIPFFVLMLLIGAIYCFVVVRANRRIRPQTGNIGLGQLVPDLPQASNSLRVLTWNIGYGGLGQKADFIIEGGKYLRPLSTKEIEIASHQIAKKLTEKTADFICLQENANAGFFTRGVPLRQIIQSALPDRLNLFWTDMKSVLVPSFLKIDHGMSVHSHVKLTSCIAFKLPQEGTKFFAGLTKHYGGLVNRIPTNVPGRDWVVFNIHLSAYDPSGSARLDQLKTLLQLAQSEFEQGHYIIIAGDWNIRLTPTDFPHQTLEKHLSWLTDFPQATLNSGWKIACDEKLPTVRSLNSGFTAGKNYTTIIDGFVHSPNVERAWIKTDDLGFEFTDHQPVEAQFRCLKNP